MSELNVLQTIEKIQAHIEVGPGHEELTHATVLCSELILQLNRRADDAGRLEAGIEDYHRNHCGCLDWRRSTSCMELYKILALASPASPSAEPSQKTTIKCDDPHCTMGHEYVRPAHPGEGGL